MSRPRDADSAKTVTSIIEAAVALLEELGVDGFSTRAVARAANLSVGTVNYYFPRLDDLVNEMLEVVHERIQETVETGLGEVALGIPPASAAVNTVVTLYRRLLAQQQLVHLRMSNNLKRGEMSEHHGTRNVYPLLDQVAGALEKSHSKPQVRLALQTLSVVISRYVVHPLAEKAAIAGLDPQSSPAVIESAIEAHLSLVARGLFEQLLLGQSPTES